MEITLGWWMIPILLVLCGLGLGKLIERKPHTGWMDMYYNAFLGVLVFILFCITAIGVIIGHLIS